MDDQSQTQSPVWMGVLAAAAILFSFALACGMPFAALGAVAALLFARRQAVCLVATGWFVNQMIGFGFLGYPFDVMTLAWGATLGVSALAAVQAARFTTARVSGADLSRPFIAFVAAWVAQQGTVFAGSLVLGGTATAFAPGVVWFVFWTNALAFAVLVTAQFIGARFGFAKPLRLAG